MDIQYFIVIPTLHYGTFQQIDPTNVIGTLQHFGQSLTKGNSWIVRDHTVNNTWLFPVSRCGTDIDPCDNNAECSDGYEGNGYKCTQIPQYHHLRQLQLPPWSPDHLPFLMPLNL
jgi:hypothetical protein